MQNSNVKLQSLPMLNVGKLNLMDHEMKVMHGKRCPRNFKWLIKAKKFRVILYLENIHSKSKYIR